MHKNETIGILMAQHDGTLVSMHSIIMYIMQGQYVLFSVPGIVIIIPCSIHYVMYQKKTHKFYTTHIQYINHCAVVAS